MFYFLNIHYNMNSQIFKKDVPIEIIFDLLDKICIKNEKYYFLNKVSYKKGEYLNILNPFNEVLLEYYHKSKHTYLTRKLSYTNFLTIIRQICRFKSINYTSKINYNKSNYEIVYFIYF